jgi:mannose-6-phosphate isomerase-like protein (cupin superfamily)
MSTQKHLVLDDDVHEVLKQRKELTGSSIKDIGNSVLRTSIESVFLGDIISRILVEEGRLSEDEYNHVLDQASVELQHANATIKVPVVKTSKGTLVSGSWEIRQIFRRSDSVFQILECWARDSRQLPMEAHRHAGDEFLIMLHGRAIVTMCGTPYTVGPLNMFQIPTESLHSVKPIDSLCHLLAILSPAVPEYFGESS